MCRAKKRNGARPAGDKAASQIQHAALLDSTRESSFVDVAAAEVFAEVLMMRTLAGCGFRKQEGTLHRRRVIGQPLAAC